MYATGFTKRAGYNNDPHTWTKWQRKKVVKYAKEIEVLTARPFYAYTTRDQKKLYTVQKAAQHEHKLPSLKYAFIPTDGETKPKVLINKKAKTVTFQVGNVTRHIIPIPLKKLASNPQKAVIDAAKTVPQCKQFSVQAGPYEIYSMGTRPISILSKDIEKLMMKYGDPDRNNYWGNWLGGIIGYTFSNQKSLQEYQILRDKYREEIQDIRGRKRKRRYDQLRRGRD